MNRSVVAVFFHLFLPLLAGLSVCPGAQLSVTVVPSDTTVLDPFYPGSGSTVTSTTDSPTGFIVTVAGRDYGANPAPGNPRWGVRAGPRPWRPNQDGFVLTNGFAPSAPGATTTASGTPASYLSITLTNVQPNTLFQNVSIVFSGLDFTSATNAWAASSPGGLSNWSVATLSGGGNRLSIDLADFTWTGGSPLELRLYGLVGQPEGAIGSVRVSGVTTLALPIPESGSAMLGVAALFSLRRRRR